MSPSAEHNLAPAPPGRSFPGPLFLKEYLAASRRARHYLLRGGYIAAMTLFLVGVWLPYVRDGEQAVGISRMADIGRSVSSAILIFQFVALQVVAITLLSGAICGEFAARTMDPLLTTPLSETQIVVGKLCAAGVHVLTLLLCSLPLLAIVRGFGGLPWQQIACFVLLTLSSALVAGSAALVLSARGLETTAVFFLSLVTAGVCSLGVPLGLLVLWGAKPPDLSKEASQEEQGRFRPDVLGCGTLVVLILALTGERGLLAAGTYLSPAAYLADGRIGGGLLLCLLVQTAMAWVMTFLAGRELARARQGLAARGTRYSGSRPDSHVERPQPFQPPRKEDGSYQRLGSALIWKDCRMPLMGSWPLQTLLYTMVFSLSFGFYVTALLSGDLGRRELHGLILLPLLLGSTLMALVMASVALSRERQSRTLGTLLTLPLSDWEIVRHKALGVLWRCRWFWAVILGHLVLFTLLGVLHPLAMLLGPPVLVSSHLFLVALGLWIGTRVRMPGLALALTACAAGGLWLILPYVAPGWFDFEWAADMALLAQSVHPGVQGYLAVTAPHFRWDWVFETYSPGWAPEWIAGAGWSVLYILGTSAAYAGAAAGLAWRAGRRLRSTA